MFEELFIQIAVILVVATALSFVLKAIRQPLMIAYILTGLIIGPSVLGMATDIATLEALSQIGIAFLLFLVGIHLDWRHIKEVGKVSLLSGIGQAVLTSALGYGIGILLNLPHQTALLIGVAFAFSSTIVVVKLLSDKEDLSRLYGRIAIGILIVQDIIAMFILIFLSAIQDGGSLGATLAISLSKAVLTIIVMGAISHFILPKILKYASSSQELLFLSALGWCFLASGILYWLGFGIEIGALIAGISLAGTGFQREVESKVKPLRDFFLVMFFIVLGMNLSFDSLEGALLPTLVFSAFILIGNPLIVLLLLRSMGYHPRTGFLTGTTVAQISEFSFIVLTGGMAAGLINANIMSMSTLVGLLTIAVSSYMITYNEQIFAKIEWAFKWMEPKNQKEKKMRGKQTQAVVFGFKDMGSTILPTIEKLGMSYQVVDFDPQMIEKMKEKEIPHIYGDAGNEELLSFLNVEKSKLVISTIPDNQISSEIIRYLKARNSKATMILTAKSSTKAKELYKLGATFVIVPSLLGGELFAQLLKKKKTLKRSWKTQAKKHS